MIRKGPENIIFYYLFCIQNVHTKLLTTSRYKVNLVVLSPRPPHPIIILKLFHQMRSRWMDIITMTIEHDPGLGMIDTVHGQDFEKNLSKFNILTSHNF